MALACSRAEAAGTSSCSDLLTQGRVKAVSLEISSVQNRWKPRRHAALQIAQRDFHATAFRFTAAQEARSAAEGTEPCILPLKAPLR